MSFLHIGMDGKAALKWDSVVPSEVSRGLEIWE